MARTSRIDLILSASAATGISVKNTKKTLEAIERLITEALVNDNSVVLLGFGTFSVRHLKPKTAVTPASSVPIYVPATSKAKFKPGRALQNALKKLPLQDLKE